jgi:quinol monooxygenase YgiN
MTETDTERVSRCVRFPAAKGRGDELAELLVAAAGTLTATTACEQYLIHRAVDGEAVWVTEVWRSRAGLAEVAR